jgi:hypothetical protein
MKRMSYVLVALLGLSACGGGARYDGGGSVPRVLFAKGPIYNACLKDGRKSSSTTRCGCVQAVADLELSQSEQRRGAGFFTDPHGLQEVRQSDKARNERFWKAWKAYGQRSADLCSNT